MALLATNHVPAVCSHFGRCEKTVKLLRAMSHPLPRLWEALEEQEANRANMEVDIVLDDGVLRAHPCAPPSPCSSQRICPHRAHLRAPPLHKTPRSEIGELEEESCHFAAELSASYAPLAADAADDEKATRWTLPSVPLALRKELDAYTVHRTAPLNRQRDGSCVVDLTVGGDKATTLRFLGWLHATHDIVPVSVSSAGLHSQWARVRQALAEKGLRYSSIANYLNGLAMVCQYVYQTYEVDADALAMATTPLDELLRLRGQCEQAKQQQLYSRRDANWIEWASTEGLGRTPGSVQSARGTTRAQAAGAQRVADRVPP